MEEDSRSIYISYSGTYFDDSLDLSELNELFTNDINIGGSPYHFIPCSIGDLWSNIIVHLSNDLWIELITDGAFLLLTSLVKWIYVKLKQSKSKSRPQQACIKITGSDIQILLPENFSDKQISDFFRIAVELVNRNPEPSMSDKKTVGFDPESNKVLMMDAEDYAMKYIYHSEEAYFPIDEVEGPANVDQNEQQNNSCH